MAARGVATASGIGTYSERMSGRPAVFFHVGLRSSLEWQCSHVREALLRMRHFVAAGP